VQIGAREHAWTRHLASKAFWRIEADDSSVRRLARRIAQKLVGIALSSGNAARHGTHRCSQSAGRGWIPIDMIAGPALALFFGAMYAAGRTN